MKIIEVTTFLLPWGSLFLKLDTDEEISGWGDCSPMNGHVIQAMVVYALKPLMGACGYRRRQGWDWRWMKRSYTRRRPYARGRKG